MLWAQGEADQPAVVRACIERWGSLNPEYELIVLREKDVITLLSDFPIHYSTLSLQALSDVVRVKLLSTIGGVWADATLFPVRPLRDWCHTEKLDFFAFENPAADRIISSWFLAASHNSPLIQRWWLETLDFWSKKRALIADPRSGQAIPADPVMEVSPQGGRTKSTYPYFWFHYLFAYLIKEERRLGSEWERASKLDAFAAHSLQILYANNHHPTPEDVKDSLSLSPVQKLDWRNDKTLELII